MKTFSLKQTIKGSVNRNHGQWNPLPLDIRLIRILGLLASPLRMGPTHFCEPLSDKAKHVNSILTEIFHDRQMLVVNEEMFHYTTVFSSTTYTTFPYRGINF